MAYVYHSVCLVYFLCCLFWGNQTYSLCVLWCLSCLLPSSFVVGESDLYPMCTTVSVLFTSFVVCFGVIKLIAYVYHGVCLVYFLCCLFWENQIYSLCVPRCLSCLLPLLFVLGESDL